MLLLNYLILILLIILLKYIRRIVWLFNLFKILNYYL